jgi:hypothetical protein
MSLSFLDGLPSIEGMGIEIKEPIEQPPVNFNSIFRDDLDIGEAHRFILSKLDERVKNSKIPFKLAALEEGLKERQTLVEKKDKLRRIEKLKLKQERLSTIKEDYTKDVSRIVEQYGKLGPIDKVLSFAKEKAKEENPLKKELRERLIATYLELTRKYYKINAVLEGKEATCPGCGQEYPKEIVDEFSCTACENCGVERKLMAKVPVSTENVKDNINRNNYEDRKNFIKSMERFQGRQVIKNTSFLFRDLDSYFTSYGYENGEKIRSRPLDNRGKKKGTNKKTMFEALAEKGYAHYYKNINLICHLYWGWALPDISGIEEKLLQDYDSFQRVYEKIKTSRKFGLNNDYMLLILLLKQNYKCSEEDFKIVKTEEIFEDYEETRRMVYKELGWRFQPLN